MTAAPIPATCPARVPSRVAPGRWPCDRHLHTDRLHTAVVDCTPLYWADPVDELDDAAADELFRQIHEAYGEGLPGDEEGRLAAIGSAVITLQQHQRLDWPEVARVSCGCGWTGDDHNRHVAEQLWATGALCGHNALDGDPAGTGALAAEMVAALGRDDEVNRAAIGLVDYWRRYITDGHSLSREALALVAAVDKQRQASVR